MNLSDFLTDMLVNIRDNLQWMCGLLNYTNLVYATIRTRANLYLSKRHSIISYHRGPTFSVDKMEIELEGILRS